MFVLGSTGEFYGLDYDEKKRAVEITVDQVKSPLIFQLPPRKFTNEPAGSVMATGSVPALSLPPYANIVCSRLRANSCEVSA